MGPKCWMYTEKDLSLLMIFCKCILVADWYQALLTHRLMVINVGISDGISTLLTNNDHQNHSEFSLQITLTLRPACSGQGSGCWGLLSCIPSCVRTPGCGTPPHPWPRPPPRPPSPSRAGCRGWSWRCPAPGPRPRQGWPRPRPGLGPRSPSISALREPDLSIHSPGGRCPIFPQKYSGPEKYHNTVTVVTDTLCRCRYQPGCPGRCCHRELLTETEQGISLPRCCHRPPLFTPGPSLCFSG